MDRIYLGSYANCANNFACSYICKEQSEIQNVPKTYVMLAKAYGNLDNDTTKERVVIYDTNRMVDMGTEKEVWVMKMKDKN